MTDVTDALAIEFRILRNGEEAVLTNVAPDVFDDPMYPQASKEFLADPRHHLVVALDNGQVIGFTSAVTYVHPDKERPELWINEVGVAPTHQRRGVARGMLKVLLDLARDTGCAEAWVLTYRTNAAAMKLYESLGAQESEDDTVMFTFLLQ
jgi:GNAT superfamily N-acetyltransferase